MKNGTTGQKTGLVRSAKGFLYDLKIKLFPRRAGKGKSSYRKGQYIFLLTMLSVPVIQFIIFWFVPNVNSIVLAFKSPAGKWSVINFKNFWERFTQKNGDLGISMINTLLYFFTSIFIRLPLTLVICYFFFKRLRGYKFFRVMFYLPAIVPVVVFTGIFKNFIAPYGPVGVLCNALKIPFPESGLLGQASTATGTIVFYSIFYGFAGHMLLISGTMSRIPAEILESAKLDGCKPGREIVSLIMPLIWPTLSIIIILACADFIHASGPILLLQPEPQYKTSTVSYWLFAQVYGSGNYGGTGRYGIVSAAGLCFTLITVPIALLCRKLLERIPAVEY